MAHEFLSDGWFEAVEALGPPPPPSGPDPGPINLVVTRAVRMVRDRTVAAADGTVINVEVDTICVHGDTPGADTLAATLRARLESAGIEIKAVGAA